MFPPATSYSQPKSNTSLTIDLATAEPGRNSATDTTKRMLLRKDKRWMGKVICQLNIKGVVTPPIWVYNNTIKNVKKDITTIADAQ